MNLNTMKLIKKKQIENHNSLTNQIDSFIGNSEDFEFSVVPAK